MGARDVIARQLGVERIAELENPSLAVGDVPNNILSPHADALALLIINTGGNVCWVRPSTPAAVNTGIVLAPNGGGVSFTYLEDLTLPTAPWWAVCSAAQSTTLYVLRLVELRTE
jgi:hypothetical protein